MKSKRGFLEGIKGANSWYKVSVMDHGLEMTLADCTRSINWWFGKPGENDAIAKITKVKSMVDEVYDHLTEKKSKRRSKRGR